MLIDTHCHLDAAEFAGDRDAVVAAARAAGVAQIVVPAVEVDNFAAVRACCRTHPICVPAYGIHPLYVDRAGAQDLASLRDWLVGEAAGAAPPVAVGEIGLDFYVPGFDADRQEALFAAQLKVASELGLPVLLHVRRSVDRVLKYLREAKVPGGIAHAFNGSRQQADEFIRRGFKLGFGGAMTYPAATRLRALASSLPIEAIVLETDSPDIAPAWIHGERNSPGQLPRIAAVLAELRDASVADIVAATGANARAVIDRAP
jgi:TatD DNase family protein